MERLAENFTARVFQQTLMQIFFDCKLNKHVFFFGCRLGLLSTNMGLEMEQKIACLVWTHLCSNGRNFSTKLDANSVVQVGSFLKGSALYHTIYLSRSIVRTICRRRYSSKALYSLVIIGPGIFVEVIIHQFLTTPPPPTHTHPIHVFQCTLLPEAFPPKDQGRETTNIKTSFYSLSTATYGA